MPVSQQPSQPPPDPAAADLQTMVDAGLAAPPPEPSTDPPVDDAPPGDGPIT